jgi:hypothetical protein
MSASEKIRQFYELKPSRFSFVTRLEWTTIPMVQGFTQRLVMHLASLEVSTSGTELILDFRDVRNVKFIAAGLAQPGLEILDATSQQWDGVTYRVSDRENDTISFLCRDFTVSLHDKAE